MIVIAMGDKIFCATYYDFKFISYNIWEFDDLLTSRLKKNNCLFMSGTYGFSDIIDIRIKYLW